jgi:hypothetical protein
MELADYEGAVVGVWWSMGLPFALKELRDVVSSRAA